MNFKFIIAAILISLLIFVCSCDDDNNPVKTEPLPEADLSFFPSKDVSVYRYETEETGSAGNQVQGNRSSFYNGTQVISGTTYKVQVDTIVSLNQVSSSTLFFRVSSGNQYQGMFCFLDSSGLASVLPPSVAVNVDPEMRILLFPMNVGTGWTVFQMTVEGTPVAPLNLRADYTGKEELIVNLNSRDTVITAASIRFNLTFTLPDPDVTYTADAYLARNIGFVKWEGNGTIVNALSSGLIDLNDTTTFIRQILKSYTIPGE